MKRKFLLPILSVCMVVALVSVGFAAWLITGNTATDTAEGSFVTYDVENDYYTVTIDSKAGETGEIVFGRPTDDAITAANLTNPWFSYDTAEGKAVGVESLTATFTVTITPDVAFATGRTVKTLLGTNNVQVTLNGLAPDQDASTEGSTAKLYDDAVGAGIVVLPTWETGTGITAVTGGDMTNGIAIKLSKDAFTVAADNTKATAEVTITYAWGKYGKADGTAENPYFHFNKMANESASREAATNALTKLYALNSAKYYLRLAVVA